jgi:hypothetical protein
MMMHSNEQLEATCSRLGHTIADALPPGIGFCFFLFDFGNEGDIAFVSNAERQGMIDALDELLNSIRAEVSDE